MKTEYIDRLRGEKVALEDTIFNDGRSDGRAYAERASYRELKLIDKMVEAFGSEFRLVELNADVVACAACEVHTPDSDTRYWVEMNLAPTWADEESYVRGFVDGALEVLAEADSVESKKD